MDIMTISSSLGIMTWVELHLEGLYIVGFHTVKEEYFSDLSMDVEQQLTVFRYLMPSLTPSTNQLILLTIILRQYITLQVRSPIQN